jgi:hypothetical protein
MKLFKPIKLKLQQTPQLSTKTSMQNPFIRLFYYNNDDFLFNYNIMDNLEITNIDVGKVTSLSRNNTTVFGLEEEHSVDCLSVLISLNLA